MAKRGPKPQDTNQRFDSKWVLDPATGCHVWQRALVPGGYGAFGVPAEGGWKRVRANRWALERKLGRPLLPGLSALHHCDNPPCVNEDHLYEGTQKQNIGDAIARQRHRPGNRDKEVCVNGHRFTPANTMQCAPSPGRPYPMRKCRACHRARMREVMRKRRLRNQQVAETPAD